MNGAKGTENICTYEDTDYYIGDDHILCLMLPNGSYNMSVGYSEDDYSGTIEVDSAMAEGILYSVICRVRLLMTARKKTIKAVKLTLLLKVCQL